MSTASISPECPPPSRAAAAGRRLRWAWRLGAVCLVAAAVLICLEVSMSPAEKRVRAYLRTAGVEPSEEAITNALGASEIPLLLGILARSNSAMRQLLMDYEEKVALAAPEGAYRRVRHATDARSDFSAASAALTILARTPAGAEALAPYLTHPDQSVRWLVAVLFWHSPPSTATVLNQALATETDPGVCSMLAGALLRMEPTNALALAIKKAELGRLGTFKVRYGTNLPR